jgi:hypothetical protein
VATVDQQPVAAGERSGRSGGRSPRELIGRYPAAIVAIALVAFSTVLVLWARTRPGFDPYGWLVWGHQTLAGNLNTNAAPSWKPLSYLFVVPYAVFGHYELWLWMITSVAISLSGVIFAGRIAYRLTGADPERRYAAWVAGVFAGLALLGIADYWHYILSFQSDPMIVSLTLGAIDCHLSGRRRWAFVLGALAGLGRPEIWLFLGLYSIWAWRADPSMRRLIVGGWIVMALLWFGIPAITSRSPFVAGSNALGSGRRLKSDRVFGTIGRFLDMNAAPLDVAGLLAILLAAWRRERTMLILAGLVVLWVLIEVAFSLHGWPGLQRYMFGAGGVLIVLAGALVGRLLSEPPRISAAARWAGVALVAVLVVATLPKAISHARTEHKDLAHQRLRTKTINLLSGSIDRLGGPGRFKGCGEPLTRLEYQTILAWNLHDNVAVVGYKYGQAIASGRPIVLFTPAPQAGGGWVIQAVHQRSAACRTLPSAPA